MGLHESKIQSKGEGKSYRGVVAKVLDFDMVVSEFEPKFLTDIFGKVMNPHVHQGTG